MRDEPSDAALRPLAWVIGGMFFAYIVQNILTEVWKTAFWDWSALTIGGLLQGRVWTLFTHPLLHQPLNSGLGILHLVGNAMLIFFFGRPVLEHFGARRFYVVLASGLAAGAVSWLAVHFVRRGELIGADAGACAMLALFCLQFANQPITLRLFFVLPVTIVPKYLGMICAGMSLIFFLFAELFGRPSGIPHSAHLGGMAAGLIAFRFFRGKSAADDEEEPRKKAVELPRWLAKKKAVPALGGDKFKVNLPANRADLKAEVDRILDKINTTGFGSLTPEEKRTLDEARDLLSKR